MTRVAVFIDYQNVYMGARSAFDLRDHGHVDGQVLPRRLGVMLCDKGRSVDPSRQLEFVSVFRGEPSPKHSPKGQAACQRQVRVWSSQARVRAITRPLKYYSRAMNDGRVVYDGREKGIDVLLALAMVTGAMNDEYDVAILFSGDTDFIPALEHVRKAGKRVEVAAWQPSNRYASRLRIPGSGPWCHLLEESDYLRVWDETDYNVG